MYLQIRESTGWEEETQKKQSGLASLLVLDHALPCGESWDQGRLRVERRDRAVLGRMPARWVLGSREQPSPGRASDTAALTGSLSPAFAGPLGHN